MNILRMINPVMEYAWGSRTFIQELTDTLDMSGKPWAELWMGAHPNCSSQILNGEHQVDLNYIIAEDPADFLGCRTAMEFKDQLPFLLKVLAAEKPLSIQTHPNAKQARQGFKLENAAGIPLDSPRRNYRDAFHKPELLVALTPFTALCGFREPSEIAALHQKYLPEVESPAFKDFISLPNPQTLKDYYNALLSMRIEDKTKILNNYLSKIEATSADTSQDILIHGWSLKLNELYPGDIGVLAPLLLNILELKPMESIYLEAGILHSYLQGAAVEIMANSDNVLRCGLTPKHTDIPELMKVVDFNTDRPKIIKPARLSDTESLYNTPAIEFSLSIIHHNNPQRSEFKPSNSAEILFCYEGNFTVENCSQYLDLSRGQSLFVPFEVEGYAIEGQGTIFRAKTNFRPSLLAVKK